MFESHTGNYKEWRIDYSDSQLNGVKGHIETSIEALDSSNKLRTPVFTEYGKCAINRWNNKL